MKYRSRKHPVYLFAAALALGSAGCSDDGDANGDDHIADDDVADDDLSDDDASDDDVADDDVADDDLSDDDASDDDVADDDLSDDDIADDDVSDDDVSDDDAGMDGDAGVEGDAGTIDPMFLTTCSGDEVDRSSATTVDSNVTADTTWSDTVYLTEAITVEAGATLTIAEGAQVIAASGAGITVSADAALIVEGSDEEVLCCAERAEPDATPATWMGIAVEADADASTRLNGLVLMDAGEENAAALTLVGEATLDTVEVVRARGDGVHATTFGADSTALSVTDCDGNAIVLNDEVALATLPTELELAGNGDDRIHIAFTEVSEDLVVSDLGPAYFQESDVSVFNGAELTIEQGVEYVLADDTYLEVGWNDEPASLFCLGTSDAPVVFRGEGEGTGLFEGLIIQDTATAASTLENVELHGGGANDAPPLAIRAAIHVVNVVVTDSASAVEIAAAGLASDSENLTITGCDEAPIRVAPNALVSLPSGDYTGNEQDRIEVLGGDFTADGTLADLGVPYFVTGDISTVEDSVFRVEAGADFVMAADTQLVFGASDSAATVVVEGTNDAMVTFTGAEETAGYWLGIVVGSNVSSESALSFAEIAHAGSETGAALLLESTIPVTDCVFRDWEGAALIAAEAALEGYLEDNTFVDGTVDDLLPL